MNPLENNAALKAAWNALNRKERRAGRAANERGIVRQAPAQPRAEAPAAQSPKQPEAVAGKGGVRIRKGGGR